MLHGAEVNLTMKSPDPLKNLSIYEQRLSRRFLQTFKQLREMQAERRALEQEHLEELASITHAYSRQFVENMAPADFGFVCSKHSWQLYQKTRPHASPPQIQPSQGRLKPKSSLGGQAFRPAAAF